MQKKSEEKRMEGRGADDSKREGRKDRERKQKQGRADEEHFCRDLPDSVNEVTASVRLRLCYLTAHLPLCLFITCVYIHVLIHANGLRRSLTRGPKAALLAADASPGSALPRRAELLAEGSSAPSGVAEEKPSSLRR